MPKAVSGSISYSESPAEVMGNALSACRKGMQAAVEHWHENIMPGHFTVAAARKYGYQPRKGDNEGPRITVTVPDQHGRLVTKTRSNPHYSWRKRREKRHNRPLVWSGDSERAARQDVRISSKREASDRIAAAATMAMPDYWYKYLKAGSYQRRDISGGMQTVVVSHTLPDKADELTRSTPAEESLLGSIATNVAQRSLIFGRGRRVVKKV